MKSANSKRIAAAAALIAGTIALAIGCVTYFSAPQIKNGRGSAAQDRAFNQTHQEVLKLAADAEMGNCVAAYKLAQHHLYATLDLKMAEKYYRLAATCPNPEALIGLIIVMRKPEHDREVDDLLASLKKLDPKKGAEASEEVALRRAERTMK